MENEKNYLEYLAELYPTIEKAATEIINLQSVINLPKGTEHFLSDIHGEYEAFSHVLRNGSGAVRKKIDDVFGHTLGISEKRALATLIYYPRERLEMEKKQASEAEARRSQIGTGDRSEKIRTYNFPQGRVTDHRIKLTLHKLDSIMNGDLDEVIDSLIAADQAAKLASMNEAV